MRFPRTLTIALGCLFALPVASASSLVPEVTSLGFDSVGYLHASDSATEAFQNTFSPQLVGKWNTYGQGAWLEAGVQADAMLLFTRASQGSVKPATYFEVPELYVGTSSELNSTFKFTLGRRLERWSRLDEKWQLGIWQPRFRWDYVHPEHVGLTGAFLTIERPVFRFVAWGSPIFVPERGVPIDVQNGAFTSSSRWFLLPPSAITVRNPQDTPLHYTLNLPPLGELVMHAGGGAMLKVGQSAGPWASAAYTYKPINQLLMANTGRLQLAARSADIHGDAQIYPRVAYHHLGTLEAGYVNDRVDASVSFLREVPVRDQTPSDWNTQEIAPATAVSSTVDVRVAGSVEAPTRVDLSVLHQWGGNAADFGPQPPTSGSRFEDRYPFQTAVMAGVRSPVMRTVSASTRVLYDIGHDGAIWSTEVRYRPHVSWMFGLGADLWSTWGKSAGTTNDFFSLYRANDRVHAGVTYVF